MIKTPKDLMNHCQSHLTCLNCDFRKYCEWEKEKGFGTFEEIFTNRLEKINRKIRKEKLEKLLS